MEAQRNDDRLLYLIARRVCHDPNLWDDLVQEARVKLWEKRAQYDPQRGDYLKWAYSAAMNTMRNALRLHSAYKPLETVPDLAIQPDVATEMDGVEWRDFLRDLLRQADLTHREHAAVLLWAGGALERARHEPREAAPARRRRHLIETYACAARRKLRAVVEAKPPKVVH